MKILLKSLITTLFILMVALAFLPKKNLYFLAETFLEKQKIILYGEHITDKPFVLSLEGAKLNYNGIDAGNIETVSSRIFLFYNVLHVKNATFVQEISQFVPNRIQDLKIQYSVLSPLKVLLNSSGDYGVLKGHFHLPKRELTLFLEPSKQMQTKYKSLMKKFKKVDGQYVYRTTL